jgi:hypothetical protein
MNEIFKIIFGDYTFVQLFGFIWFFIIGYIIYGLTETIGRDKTSIITPPKWNFNFWFKDNWRRYLVTFLSTYVYFRFYIQFVGHPLANFDALTIGLIGDGIGALLKKKVKAFSADRVKLMKEYNEDHLKKVEKQKFLKLLYNKK